MLKKKEWFLPTITTVLCLVPMILTFSLYGKLPSDIPIHLNNAGTPDSFIPKTIFAFGVPVLLALLNLYVSFRVTSDPKKGNSSNVMRSLVQWLVPVISLLGVSISVFASLGHKIPVNIVISSITGIVVVICGNFLPKSKQNYTIGIKLPWTLNSESNWNKTHRFAGALWVIVGLVIIVCGLLQIFSVVLSLLLAFITIAAPIVYSYSFYKRAEKA